MKIRSGFVSNSSSSSFIIGFDRVPKDVNTMKKTLFGDDETGKKDDWDDTLYSNYNIAERVLNDISDKKPITIRKEKKIIEEIGSGYFDDYPDLNWFYKRSYAYHKEFRNKTGKDLFSDDYKDTPEREEYYRLRKEDNDEYRAKVDIAAGKLWNSYKATFEGKKIFFVSYSEDNGSLESFMERGTIFSRIPHIRISHH